VTSGDREMFLPQVGNSTVASIRARRLCQRELLPLARSRVRRGMKVLDRRASLTLAGPKESQGVGHPSVSALRIRHGPDTASGLPEHTSDLVTSRERPQADRRTVFVQIAPVADADILFPSEELPAGCNISDDPGSRVRHATCRGSSPHATGH
jgi:hypothetical protein